MPSSTLTLFRRFRSVLHPSRCSQPIPTIGCFCLVCTSDVGSAQQMSKHFVVECGIHGHPANVQICFVNVSRSGFCSHFGFQPSFECPNPCLWISRTIQLDLLSPLRRTPLFPRSWLSNSESVDPDCTVCFPICDTNPIVLCLETGSPPKLFFTKAVVLSTCSCLRNRIAASGFPNRYRAAFQWNKTKQESLMHADLHRVCICFLQNWTPSSV